MEIDFTGSDGKTYTAVIGITVRGPVDISLSVTPASKHVGDDFTLTATVTPTDAEGSVIFYNYGARADWLTETTVVDGTATFTGRAPYDVAGDNYRFTAKFMSASPRFSDSLTSDPVNCMVVP